MEFLVVLAVLALVALFVTRPLWRATRPRREARAEADRIAELEAARDAKYHEIRDAELDRRTGKLSQQDFEAVDRALRAEAIEILRALDEARERVNGRAERLPSAKP
jgi:type II secretory pathway component PulJ